METLDYILIEQGTTQPHDDDDDDASKAEIMTSLPKTGEAASVGFRVARMPTREEAAQDTALPSWQTPSDHVSIMVDIRLKDR